MKCRKCGAEVEAPRTVCPNCGTSVLKQDFSVVWVATTAIIVTLNYI